LPARNRRVGLRELGLPYESEPAITKHLAGFLSRATRTPSVTATRDSRIPNPGSRMPAGEAASGMACPDVVLFNGGFFAPAIARERVLDALTSWCGRRPL